MSKTEIRSIFLSILKLCSVLEQISPLRVQQIHISSICGTRYNGRRIGHHVSNNLTCTDSSQVWYHLSSVSVFFCRENHHPQNSQKNLCQKPAQNYFKKNRCEKVAVSKAGENSVSPFVAFVVLVVAAAVLVVVIVLVVLVVVACC